MIAVPSTPETSSERLDRQRLIQAFARLRPAAFGISCGTVAGILLFLLTAILVVKGPAAPGLEVAPHLAILSNYLPGYRVTWPGAFIGFLWSFPFGFLSGYLLASFLNFHHALYLRVLERGFRREGLLNG